MIAFLLACDQGFSDPDRALGPEVTTTERYPVVVDRPATLGVVDTPRTDIHGTPIGVACVTCHGPDPQTAWAARPGEAFHTGISLQHGALSCNSCHNPEDRTELRLADGTLLEMSDAMQLCAQCHGPQYRDYQHGAHGGMAGYWDTRRGPRDRNNCVSCHAPHNPAYQQVLPVFSPPVAHPE